VPTPIDETALKVHVGPDGHVWYSAGFGAPRDSGQAVEAFLLSSVCSGGNTRVRLLGIPANADLIAALYLRRANKELAGIDIAGPNICESQAELADPELVLHRMRATSLTPAVGGWHSLTQVDYFTYSLIARLQKSHDVLDTQSTLYLYSIPVYRALSFVPTLSNEQAAQLIKTIVDPRWYVDRRAPDRQGKLDLFMGLTPGTQQLVSRAGSLIHKPRELRCALVLTTWKTVSEDLVDLTDPRNFLYRIQKNAGGGWRGDLRASQALLRYLRYNWLETLEQRSGPRDRLFVPELFFKTPGEIESYLQHTAH